MALLDGIMRPVLLGWSAYRKQRGDVGPFKILMLAADAGVKLAVSQGPSAICGCMTFFHSQRPLLAILAACRHWSKLSEKIGKCMKFMKNNREIHEGGLMQLLVHAVLLAVALPPTYVRCAPLVALAMLRAGTNSTADSGPNPLLETWGRFTWVADGWGFRHQLLMEWNGGSYKWHSKPRWWQLNFFNFHPENLGKKLVPILTCTYFSKKLGLNVQPPTRITG